MADTIRALISVSDKAGVVDFAQALADMGAEILSTGGTAAALRDDEHVLALIQRSTESGGELSLSLVETDSDTNTREPVVACAYEISDGTTRPARFSVTLLRSTPPGNGPRWLVQSWSMDTLDSGE